MRLGWDRYSDVVANLYEAALDAELWPVALEAVGELLATPMINLVVYDKKTDTVPFSLGVNMTSDDLVREYNEEVVRIDPRVRFAAERPDVVIHYDYLHTSEAEMERHPYYADFLRRGHVRYFLAAVAIDDAEVASYWTMQRTAADGHVQRADIDAFTPLVPHIRRALQISRTLCEANMRASASAYFVDDLASGVVLLDRHARVVFANETARKLAARGDALALGAAGLAALRPVDDRTLKGLVAGALAVSRGDAIVGGGELALLRRDADRPYTLTVSPLGRRVPVFGAEPPAVAILIGDPDAAPELSVATLQRRWRLTPREAEVALQVGSGRSLAEIAEALVLSPRTVEVHLRHVFAKTGAHRQADLVRMLMAAPRPGRNDGTS